MNAVAPACLRPQIKAQAKIQEGIPGGDRATEMMLLPTLQLPPSQPLYKPAG